MEDRKKELEFEYLDANSDMGQDLDSGSDVDK
jgi:hypothetical protein